VETAIITNMKKNMEEGTRKAIGDLFPDSNTITGAAIKHTPKTIKPVTLNLCNFLNDRDF